MSRLDINCSNLFNKEQNKEFLNNNEKSENDKIRRDKLIKEFLIDKHFEVSDIKLGEGAFGSVFDVTLKNGRKAAVKVITIDKVDKPNSKQTETKIKSLKFEIGISLNLHHSNIIKTFAFISNKDTIQKNNQHKQIYIFALIMEKALHGCLGKILHYIGTNSNLIPLTFANKLTENENIIQWAQYNNGCLVLFFLKQIISSIECLNRNLFVHYDIKPENILIGSGFICKLCDFSLTKRVNLFSDQKEEEKEEKMMLKCGTHGYVGKEFYTETSFPKFLSDRVDIFALGSMIYHLIFRKRLFLKKEREQNNFKSEFSNILNKKIEEIQDLVKTNLFNHMNYDKKTFKLLLKMLSNNIEERPNIYKILSNKWINQKTKEISKTYYTSNNSTAKFLIDLQKLGYCYKEKKEAKEIKQNSYPLNNTKNRKFLYKKHK